MRTWSRHQLVDDRIKTVWTLPCTAGSDVAKQNVIRTVGSYATKCMSLSLLAYRPYTFYHTNVDIAMQTVIQTVGIYGTDVQTVRLLKTLEL